MVKAAAGPKKSSAKTARPRSGTKPAAEAAAAIARLAESAKRGELVVVIGTGVSLGLAGRHNPALSWTGLVRSGFDYANKKAKITKAQSEAWEAQLSSTDLDDLLGAAEFMGRKLDAPGGDLYARWLRTTFESVVPENPELEEAIRSLHFGGIRLCTLNYDHLLERVTGLPTVTLRDAARVVSWMRAECSEEGSGILHLHGSWDAPATCVLGIRDYETTIRDDVRDLIQRSLASFKRLLFIGCGDTFSDPNLGALIRWLRSRMPAAAPQHYALVDDEQLPSRHADPDWHGFVEPLSYGAQHADLAKFIRAHFAKPMKSSVGTKPASTRLAASKRQDTHVLQAYRQFLLKDCGQMTIEGVRADMDTAQRRFDIERLFVPLKLTPPAPEIPDTDPERQEKLLKWRKGKGRPRSFGKVFSRGKRLALLALPGGGKTLLLKRLAVAYAEPFRRAASDDALPDLDLLPVLIRCREWREHIHRPIPSLLQNISTITGQASLEGLSDALLPMLKAGKVLLLVDGLDEIHDDALRTTFADHLETFLEEYESIRLVVTSREAGFGLVAPCLARFCERWRLAPLEPEAIYSLCLHWHLLMAGDSPETRDEAREVAKHLTTNSSLLRLAENPLLLTMLLVVKHGAGRLPPDRVGLYGRAVEVLLDTWNIKGHEPLNPKEAVPQLAFVALRLMLDGKQTATERELLKLLDEARETVPQIRRYAKDTPHDFLKRVELRSSLIVEAGYQVEDGQTVPFYQFRHLTFQEYLAAVAAVEGHYSGYQKTDTVLTPLEAHLTAEEWKEVIPMAAVLARKQAEPLIAALVAAGVVLRKQFETPAAMMLGNGSGDPFPPVSRLLQCLAEEAETSQDTLASSLQLAAFFGMRWRFDSPFAALCRGPYGAELFHQAWTMYSRLDWPEETWLFATCMNIAEERGDMMLQGAEAREVELRRLLTSDSDEETARVLFYSTSILRKRDSAPEPGPKRPSSSFPFDLVDPILFHPNPAVAVIAAYVWSWHQRLLAPSLRSTSTIALDRLFFLWSTNTSECVAVYFDYSLGSLLGVVPRHDWTPSLTKELTKRLQRANAPEDWASGYEPLAATMVLFHSRGVVTDELIVKRILKMAIGGPARHAMSPIHIDAVLEQLGPAGTKAKRRFHDAEKTMRGRRGNAIVIEKE